MSFFSQKMTLKFQKTNFKIEIQHSSPTNTDLPCSRKVKYQRVLLSVHLSIEVERIPA